MELPQKKISAQSFNYNLPNERIAKYPLSKRDDSKLLLYKNGSISNEKFRSLPNLINSDSLLVFNNTKVIQARINFQKSSGANIEIFCLEPDVPSSYEDILVSLCKCSWKCIVGNSKKWKDEVLQKTIQDTNITVSATRKINNQTHHIIEFSWNGDICFGELLEKMGQIPIPPYLNRNTESIDLERYQTVYSKNKGSVAAPTAGLHFTDEIFSQLKAKNVAISELTLHVGAGTFKPVMSDTIGDHEMHTELFSVKKSTIEAIMAHKDSIVAVGTTSLRSLESIYWLGSRIVVSGKIPDRITQWEIYDVNSLSLEESLLGILNYMKTNNIDEIKCLTQIIIAPGYKFRVAKALITNFHQPQSTLLLLVSAFIGEKWKSVYDFALNNDFRFLSYGDSSLLFHQEI